MLVIVMRLVFCLCDYDCKYLFLILNSDKLILSVESRQGITFALQSAVKLCYAMTNIRITFALQSAVKLCSAMTNIHRHITF